MKKILAILIIINTFFALCGCTREPLTDIYGFCERVNAADPVAVIDETAYFFDGGSQYSYFTDIGNTQTVLVLETDGNGIVAGVRLTAVNENGALASPEARQSFFDYFILLCSVLSCDTAESLKDAFFKNGLTADRIIFGGGSISFEYRKYSCFLYSGEYAVSLYFKAT